jgi:hypothetical protein
MMWSSLFAVPLIYLETYYLTQERFLKTYYVSATARPVLIIALLPFLTYHYGALGAIWTKFAVRGLQALILYIKLIFDWRMLAREAGHAQGRGAPLGPVEFARCPLCGEAATDPVWATGDRRRGLPGRFVIARCRSCGALRSHPRLTPAGRVRYAAPGPEASAAFPTPAADARGAERRRAWFVWLAAGCPGPREIGWRAWLTTLPARFGQRALVGANVLAFPADGRRLLLNGSAAERHQAALAAWGWRSDRDAGERASHTYDAVCLAGSLERADDPLAELRRAREQLAPRGVLAVTTPLADGLLPRLTGHCWSQLDQPRQLTLFTQRRLCAALRATGFRVVATAPRSAAASWVESFGALAAEGSLTGWGLRLLRSRWAAAPAAAIAWLADLIGRGDEAMVLAIRDDAPAAGWAPREIRERQVR